MVCGKTVIHAHIGASCPTSGALDFLPCGRTPRQKNKPLRRRAEGVYSLNLARETKVLGCQPTRLTGSLCSRTAKCHPRQILGPGGIWLPVASTLDMDILTLVEACRVTACYNYRCRLSRHGTASASAGTTAVGHAGQDVDHGTITCRVAKIEVARLGTARLGTDVRPAVAWKGDGSMCLRTRRTHQAKDIPSLKIYLH